MFHIIMMTISHNSTKDNSINISGIDLRHIWWKIMYLVIAKSLSVRKWTLLYVSILVEVSQHSPSCVGGYISHLGFRAFSI